MHKGYWIAQVDVSDAEAYQGYIAANKAVFEKFGGRFLVRNGQREVVEGAMRPRIVVLEFDSYQTALACYRSPEYQHAMSLRTPCSEADIVIIEGYQDVGPQAGGAA